MDLPSPRDNQFLFLDMNSFFASCEQHFRPELRGKPIVVAPTVGPSGCVIAASYEAKALGVRTGWRVGEAQKIIPNLAVVDARHRNYVEIHTGLKALLEREFTPDPLVLSVDEFGIPLDKTEQWTPNAHKLALRVKQRIFETFSPALRCSIGIGPNMFLSKLGTEVQKPDGLVIMQLHTLEEAFKTLKLRDIPGINWGMSNRLATLGIRTALNFFNAPHDLLHSTLGILGDAWWYNLHGYRVDVAHNATKSMSHSHVLAPKLRTKAKARAVIYKLCIKLADRLREKDFDTTHIAVWVRSKPSWQYSFAIHPTQDPFTIFRVIAKAYDETFPDDQIPHQANIVVYGLVPRQTNTLGLFPSNELKASPLFASVDALNHRFGRWTVQPASTLPVQDSAPNRITFRVPDFEMD